MKKILTTIVLTLVISAFSFANDKTFSFDGYIPFSNSVLNIKNEFKNDKNLPVFEGDEKIVKNMNETIEKFANKYKNNEKTKVNLFYQITANNDYFASVFVVVEETNLEKKETKVHYKGLNFNVKTGNTLNISNLFVPGYQSALNGVISDRIKQFGIPTTEKFKGLQKNQEFYMYDDFIVIIYGENEATDFGDKVLFLPFMTSSLMGILK